MLVRSLKIRYSNGTMYDYVRTINSAGENGKVKQKVVASPGRRDTLEAILPMLNRFRKGDQH